MIVKCDVWEYVEWMIFFVFIGESIVNGSKEVFLVVIVFFNFFFVYYVVKVI